MLSALSVVYLVVLLVVFEVCLAGGVVGGIVSVVKLCISFWQLIIAVNTFTVFVNHNTHSGNHLLFPFDTRICAIDFFYMVEMSSFTTF